MQGNDGAPEAPANAKMAAAAPRPKPLVTGEAPPRPAAPGRPPPPPPVPTAAKGARPPTRDANPFLSPAPTVDLDDSALAEDDTADASVTSAKAETPPVDPGASAIAAVPQPAPPMTPPTAEPAPIAAALTPGPEKTRSSAPASTPTSPPIKKRSGARVLAFAFLAVVVLVGGGFAYQSQVTARASSMQRAEPQASTDATVEPPAPAHEPAPPPTHTAEPQPSATAAKKKSAAEAGSAAAAVSADPASQGILDTMQIPPGRKIIVDGRVVGTSPRRVPVRCGTHRIQIGDLVPENIALPCGGEVSFTE